MKDKLSDDTSTLDSLPEDKQKLTEKGKIELLDVVVLTEDIPEHNLKRGEVGTVVEILSNGEAFEVEFSDGNGQMYKSLSFLESQLEVLPHEPINVNPNRQANDVLKGYYYQLCHTVDAWLDLDDNDVLYVEVAEDFDIEKSDGTFTATQVKHTQHNITLRSEQVTDAINNFWELRSIDQRVKFRLLTKSKITKEQESPFGIDKQGLELWSRCSGDETVTKKISDFLQNIGKISEEVKSFLKKASPQEIYEQLIEPITWETDCKPISFVKKSICEKLIHHGDRHGISFSKARDIIDPLINEAWKVATQSKNRKLTRLLFLDIFEKKTKRLVSEQYLQHLEMSAMMEKAVKAESVGSSFDSLIQSYPQIQTDIPRLYLNVVVPRTELLTNIQTKLQSDGIAVIQGGVDKGKTTLANLTAKTINESWFWLKLTNKKASQVSLLLKHLANSIRHESTQVNAVIDDLNLQPQQLQIYEDDLGLVGYRILERGAKMIITTQQKPPGNLIRRLGVSSNVVINVPNFTTSEIEQFALHMGCSTTDVEAWVTFIHAHTGGHPRLVHARLAQLREEGWKQPDSIESIVKTPVEVVEEQEAARQMLTDLPEDHRKFLYRLSLIPSGFRRDYAINIGEIPEAITDPGDIFSQLVGPWIDQFDETYYTISPLLSNAAKKVWSESKIKDLHAQIAYAMIKTKKLNTIESWAVFTHSMAGQFKEGIVAFIYSLMNAPQNDWKDLCQEFSLLAHIKIDPPEELFPGDTFLNQMFRSLQFDIAVEVEPEYAPKILEIWEEETKPYEPHQSYILSRLMLATKALSSNQVILPAKKIVSYLDEMISIKDSDNDVWEHFYNSMGQIEGHKYEKSNFFSTLFGNIYARQPIYATFLKELIEAIDELQPDIRTILLVDFEEDTIDSRVLIDGIWGSESDLESPDWTGCIQVFDKVIEKTIAWGYLHFAAAAARGKAIIYDEHLNEPDTAHRIMQDFVSKVGPSSIIEEEQATIYLHQERYKEALNVYERILPVWNPPSGQIDVVPSEGYRRAAICAAHLDDWKKVATFLEEAAERTHKTVNAERYVGFYADAGFAHFKAGNMMNCIKFLHLALQNFEMLPQDNTDVKYFTLRKRLEHTIKWIKMIWYEWEDNSSLSFEPFVGFCSDPETKEEYLTLPDCPTGYSWLYLSQIEYSCGHDTTVFQQTLQTTDREEYPILNYWFSFLEAQYDFRNKAFDNLPQRIYQLALVYSSMKKHHQSGRGAAEKGSYSISNTDLSDYASVNNIIAIFVAALIVEMQTNSDTKGILAKWRTNSSELPIKDKIYSALDLVEAILLGDYNEALTVMYTPNEKVEKLLVASIRVIHNAETSLEDLLFAHTYISSSFINSPWQDFVIKDLVELLSLQWLEKIKFRAKLKTPMLTVPQIKQACESSETGKKKIAQILLAVHQAVSVKVPLSPKFFQRFRTWTESESNQK